jgi:hypothetical protein
MNPCILRTTILESYTHRSAQKCRQVVSGHKIIKHFSVVSVACDVIGLPFLVANAAATLLWL